MKKVIILLAFLITTVVSAAASDMHFHACSFNFKSGAVWDGWKPCDIEINWNGDTKHIEIYSNEVQVLDYTSSTKEVYSHYVIYSSAATDRKYKDILITFQFFDSGVLYLTITYPNYSYSYMIRGTK